MDDYQMSKLPFTAVWCVFMTKCEYGLSDHEMFWNVLTPVNPSSRTDVKIRFKWGHCVSMCCAYPESSRAVLVSVNESGL